MAVRAKPRLRKRTMTAAAAAALCVLAPWAVMLGPVPITLCTLAIYLMAFVLDGKGCLAAVAVYVLLGAAGLPVYAGFGAGTGWLLGPTGGFLLAYPVMGLLCARLLERGCSRWLALGLGTLVLYALGTVWYCLQTGVGLWGGAAVCVLPFLPGDALKLSAAAALGPVLRDRLVRAGLIET